MSFALAEAGALALSLAEATNAANLWCQYLVKIHQERPYTTQKAKYTGGDGKARGSQRKDE